MSPTRRSFVKAAAAAFTAPAFRWPVMASAQTAPLPVESTRISLFVLPVGSGKGELHASCWLRPNGALEVEHFTYRRNPDTNDLDLVVFEVEPIAAPSERLTIPELLDRLKAARDRARAIYPYNETWQARAGA
jgi:hypothetical protein